ncbi:nuclear transport factor 2 family protein [Streptomyces sp. NPDC001220]
MDSVEAIPPLVDRANIIDVAAKFAASLDLKRWDDYGACLADEIEIHMPIMGGWVTMRREELVAIVDPVYGQMDACQHISANHQVTVSGYEATCLATLNATHWLKEEAGERFQREVGCYEYRLVRSDGWKIIRKLMTISWAEGNTEALRRVQSNAAMPTAQV